MTSTRAADVAEVLWELKRADKVATFSSVAERAGFSAGANGRSMITCIRNVRKDWPHLQWWRAINDKCLLENDCEQVGILKENGLELNDAEGEEGMLSVVIAEEQTMRWDDAHK
ncbi:hypothetical protein MNBD_PLANCTO02-1290 [hydrothermal vent metagenome]|uniref:Methylated-DNA-[protein]-cysteine S-methyltransferase DNA binding domain-containing protein n=1 Tax=hydrothermal vent metagenome TaxID=652676 RepID=A0A3B1D530_9ZZZZ